MKDQKSRVGMLIVILVALLSGFALGKLDETRALGQSAATVNPSPTPSTTQQTMQKWEYKVILVTRDQEAIFNPAFNKAGEEGWEYVGVVTNNGLNAHYVAFKRPKQ
jgi:hypothetical protein